MALFGARAARPLRHRANNMVEAERQFSALIGDQGTPSNLRERANMMVSLIVGAPQALSTTAK